MRKDMTGIISIEEMPDEHIFLAQVIEFLDRWFPEEGYTHNIVQNYIKSGIISRPLEGRKRGYARMHIIQLILLSYLRPILSAEEIRMVFSLAFNEINEADDDIITWEDAYRIFLTILTEDDTLSPEEERRMALKLLKDLKLEEKDKECIVRFISVLIICTKATFLKRRVMEYIDKDKAMEGCPVKNKE